MQRGQITTSSFINSRIFIAGLFGALLTIVSFGIAACAPTDGSQANKPTVTIDSPPSGSTFLEGDNVAVQSTARAAQGITRVELLVDGVVVRTDPSPIATGQPSLTLIQNWTATVGNHTLTVRAYNTQNVVSDPLAINVTVLAAVTPSIQTPVPIVSPTPTASTAPTDTATATNTTLPPPPNATRTATSIAATSVPPPPSCVDNAAFVSDVTIPDNTVLAPGQSFVKSWRLRNSGTCTWDNRYTFAFVSGARLNGSPAVAVPPTAPGATADISIPMQAPTTPGRYVGSWQMRNPNGIFFGSAVSVIIVVPGPATATPTNTPTPTSTPSCPGPPVIPYFTASPNPIANGQTTTLSWGFVSGATSVKIDNGIVGVATPGSIVVAPKATTTYTLTATGCGGTSTKSVTVTVTPYAITNFSASWKPSPSGGILDVTVDYFYNGDRGTSNIFMSAYALNNNNDEVPDTQLKPAGPLDVGSGTVTVRIKRTTPGDAFTSTKVRVCMYKNNTNNEFYCQEFPFKVVWPKG